MLNRLTTIKIDDVRERTKMQLRLQNTTEHDDYLDVLILEGLRNLNNLYQLGKFNCKLEIEDHKACLPKNFIRLIGFSLSCDDGGGPILYADTRFLTECQCDLDEPVFSYNETVQINKGYAYFRSDLNIDEARIAYYGLNVDDFGNMVIYEDFERALTHYACWNFMMAYYEDYPMNLTETHRRNYVSQKGYLKGLAQAEDFNRNKREIQNIFKSKLVSNLYNI